MSEQSETARAVAESCMESTADAQRFKEAVLARIARALLDAEARAWRKALWRVRFSLDNQREQNYDNECRWAAGILERIADEFSEALAALAARAEERQRAGAEGNQHRGGKLPESAPSVSARPSDGYEIRSEDAAAATATPPSASHPADARAEVIERAQAWLAKCDEDKWIAEADALRDELAEARETISRLNRRCQVAEAGVMEKVRQSDGSLGRTLANAAASALKAELERVRKERDKYHDTLIARHGGEPIALLRELDEAREELERLRSKA
jgi:hypothetical protein